MKYLGRLKSGEYVYNRKISHVDNLLLDLIVDSLDQIDSKERNHIEESIIFDHNIGICKVVKTQSSDHIYFAKRKNRDGLSRIVKDREGIPSNILTIVLLKTKYNYTLITGYIGERVGPEPFSKFARKSDIEYWNTHAFVDKLTDIDQSTITLNPPQYFNI